MCCCRLLTQLTTHVVACRTHLLSVRSAWCKHYTKHCASSECGGPPAFIPGHLFSLCLTLLSNGHLYLQATRSTCLFSNLEKPAPLVEPMQLALSSLLCGDGASSTCRSCHCLCSGPVETFLCCLCLTGSARIACRSCCPLTRLTCHCAAGCSLEPDCPAVALQAAPEASAETCQGQSPEGQV